MKIKLGTDLMRHLLATGVVPGVQQIVEPNKIIRPGQRFPNRCQSFHAPHHKVTGKQC